MNNGMTFGLDGPVVTGWWVNPKTGDKFNAVDTFFEDNQIFVKTSDGRLLKYSQIQNYLKTDNPDAFIKTKQPSSSAKEEIPAEILNEIASIDASESDDLLIPDDNIFGNPSPAKPAPEKNVAIKPIADEDIIERALGKKTKPKVEGAIKWRSFPKQEIEMLKDLMGVSEGSIVDYYVKYLSVDDIVKSLTDSIRNYIKDQLTEKPKKK